MIFVHTFINVALIVISTVLINGCVSNYKLSEDNYRSLLEVKVYDREYYSASHIDSSDSKKWFPPITNNIPRRFYKHDLQGLDINSSSYKFINSLVNKKYYKANKKLEIQRVNIELHFEGSFLDKKAKDFLFLAAADVALQNGFPYLTRVTEGIDANCSSTYSANTTGNVNLNTSHSGSISGNQINGTSNTTGTYTGVTKLREKVSCLSYIGGEFILFKNSGDLKNGVFKKNRYTGQLDPVTSLYYSTSPNAIMIDNPPEQKVTVNIRKIVINSAWKKGYIAENLSKDIRNKYKITDQKPYIVIYEKEERTKLKLKREQEERNDPILKNRINQ